MDVLAKQIAAAGIKRVRGDIVGDATAFDDKLVPDGWKTSYLGAAYAARVSALSLNENLVWVAVQPAGGKALVTLEPATTAIPVESTVRARRRYAAVDISAVAALRRRHRRARHDRRALRTAQVFARRRQSGAVHDRRASRVAPEGGHHGRRPDATRRRRRPAPTEVAALASPPLAQIIGEMDRESINVVAELLFRAAAHVADERRPAIRRDGPREPARAS